MLSFDRFAVAARLRSIIGAEGGDLSVVARKLGVGEWSVRLSLDPDAPEPTVEVMLAVVRVFGVDPSWLLTGEYDPATHRAAAESDRSGVRETLDAIRRRQQTPGKPLASPNRKPQDTP